MNTPVNKVNTDEKSTKTVLYSVRELAQAWINFKPVVPLSFIVACRQAIREKYR